jgi:hypothetical protein
MQKEETWAIHAKIYIIFLKEDHISFCSEHAFIVCTWRNPLPETAQRTGGMTVLWQLWGQRSKRHLWPTPCPISPALDTRIPTMGGFLRYKAPLFFCSQGTTFLKITKYHPKHIQTLRAWKKDLVTYKLSVWSALSSHGWLPKVTGPCGLARATTTKYHRLHGFNNKTLFSHNSEARSSKVKVLAELVPLLC